MKILQINTTYRTGGSTGRIVFELSQIIKDHGDAAYCAFGYEYKPTNDANTYRIENIPQLKWSIFQTRLLGEHGFYNRAETKKLLHWIDMVKPDIIHLHNLHNHYLNLEILFEYIREKKIPIVWTLHDCWSFTGWCAYFDYAGCSKWKDGCGDCPCLKDYPKTWFFDRSRSNYLRKKKLMTGIQQLYLVAPSKWLADLTRESFLKEYPISVIHNGINLQNFSTEKKQADVSNYITEKERRRIILGVASSWSHRKGLDEFLRLNERLDHKRYVLALVGLKKEQLSYVPDNVYKILRTNNVEELAELYQRADIFLNLTLEDNYPTTNLEAQACGTPVITYKTGGSPESVLEGKTGFIIDTGNIEMLLNRIEVIEENLEEFSQNAGLYAKDHFDQKMLFEQYITLYQNILR